MEFTDTNADFSRYGKAFQEQLCMVILDDRPFADQVEEVLDVSFLELKYLRLFIDELFSYRKKYGVHPSRQIMATILRAGIDHSNALTQQQVREYYARVMTAKPQNSEYIKETTLDFCRKQNLKSAMIKSIALLQSSSFDEISKVINDSLKLGADNNAG